MMNRFKHVKAIGAGLILSTICVLSIAPAFAKNTHAQDQNHTVFVSSAKENADFSQVTLPLHKAVSHGQTVYYVITEASNAGLATQLGVNTAAKLANAKGTAAVQQVTGSIDGQLSIPATVNFGGTRVVQPGATGFPPAAATPAATGEDGYSPLLELPDGTVINAPQIANASGQADKVVSIDTTNNTVVYRETNGFYNNHAVHYVSFEASDVTTAALEDVTYAPALNTAPTPGDVGFQSARAGIIAFTNGQTGADNPQRQGLSSAILDNNDPLNVIQKIPHEADYSPLWDVYLTTWTQQAIDAGQNLRQKDFDTVSMLGQQGQVTSFGGQAFGPAGIVVNCPVISEEAGL